MALAELGSARISRLLGLGFGRQFENFPFGGIETFKYFLSTGLEGQGRDDLVKKICSLGSREQMENFLQGERYKKTPALVENFLKELPSLEVSKRYVVFKLPREGGRRRADRGGLSGRC